MLLRLNKDLDFKVTLNQNRSCLLYVYPQLNALMPPSSPSCPRWLALTNWFVCVCVYIHSLSCLTHCANTLESDPVLILSQKWKDMPIHRSLHSFTSPTFQPYSHLGPDPEHPRSPRAGGASGVHPRVQQEHFVTRWLLSGCPWQSRSRMDYLFSYCICLSYLWDFCS